MGNFAPVASARPRRGAPASTRRDAGVLEGQVEGIFRASRVDRPTRRHPLPVSRPKSRLTRYVLPRETAHCAAATTPASRRSDICEGGCGLTGRQRGVFNHDAALWGRPFHYCRVSAGAGARGVENPRTARLVHHINSDGPRARSTGGSPHESAIASGRRRSERVRPKVSAKTDAGARLSAASCPGCACACRAASACTRSTCCGRRGTRRSASCTPWRPCRSSCTPSRAGSPVASRRCPCSPPFAAAGALLRSLFVERQSRSCSKWSVIIKTG